MKNIIVLTNIAPHYRSLLWETLLKNKKYKFDFFYGKSKKRTINEINFDDTRFKDIQDKLHIVNNIYIKNKLLIWQNGIIIKCLISKIDAAIISGDSWVLSNWIVSIILRLKGAKVIFWSHGIYGNEQKLKKWIKILFYKLANEHLLYERRGKELMVSNGFKESTLHVIFNSLDYNKNLIFRKSAENINKKDIYPFFLNHTVPTLIFIGRLTKIKKLHFLISAVKILADKNHDVNLLFIGEGEEKGNLSQLVEKYNINDRCYFYGSCYSEDKLSKLISTADLCVSPGNVGLTAIHCLGYGTPVLTHNNFFNQMPEVGVINESTNGCFFKENDIDSLVNQIKSWLFDNNLTRTEIRKNCYHVIDKYYNPNYQVMVIENLIENKLPLI